MIFQHTWQQVIGGSKTQTRRLVKPGEYALNVWGTPLHDDLRIGMSGDADRIGMVYHANKRLKWRVGDTYAVQPGRGKKAVGRIRLTAIRQERVNNITESDVIAEGCGLRRWWSEDWPQTTGFAELWCSIHTAPGTTWYDNPLVWVLEFEVVS